jgi:hypothetical protein
MKARFLADGGKCIALTEEDLRTFIGLHDLYASRPDGFMAWLQTNKPLCKTSFSFQADLRLRLRVDGPAEWLHPLAAVVLVKFGL